MMNPLDTLRDAARDEAAEVDAFAADVPTFPIQARDRLVQRILAAQGAPASGARTSDVAALDVARARRRGPRATLVAAGGLVAAAAALVLWLRPAAEDLALPAYTVAAEGGAKQVRGAGNDLTAVSATGATQIVERATRLVLTVRPETDVAGATVARAFVDASDGARAAIAAVPVDARVAPSGSVQLTLQGTDLMAGRHGRAVLRVVVGRPHAVEALGADAIAHGTSGPGWREVTVPLVLVGS